MNFSNMLLRCLIAVACINLISFNAQSLTFGEYCIGLGLEKPDHCVVIEGPNAKAALVISYDAPKIVVGLNKLKLSSEITLHEFCEILREEIQHTINNYLNLIWERSEEDNNVWVSYPSNIDKFVMTIAGDLELLNTSGILDLYPNGGTQIVAGENLIPLTVEHYVECMAFD